MYSLKHALTQSPETVKTTLMSVVGVVLALVTDIEPTLLETVGVWLAVERVLTMFYVKPVQVAQAEAAVIREQEVALQGIELGKQISNGGGMNG